MSAAGLEPVRIDLPDGEEAKSVAVAERCWSILGNAGFTRSDAVVGLGGGATTDLAGFVAATWLRGVRMIMVPTTLLGMVDAAVGGKTGINTAEGKNLVGCFYEPVSVICDLDALATLPTADLIAGLAEVIKCGFIADPVILTMIESDPAVALRADSAMLRELVERAVSVKAAVVSADLRESTSTGSAVGRELLNYGHTIGHAIERRESFTWRHGNAISVGMVYAAELARLAGRLDHETANRHRVVLSQVGLPTTYAADAFDDLLHTMALDKKARGSTLRFVILNGLASAEILAAPSEDLLRAAYAASCSLGAASVGNRAPTHGGGESEGVLSFASDDDGGGFQAQSASRAKKGSQMIEAWGELNVRETFAEAARTYAALVRRIPEDRWNGPGLGEWDLRALIGHTSRSLVTVETYLAQPVDTEEVPTPAAYYVAIAGIDHAAVVGRGVEAGRALGDNPAEFVDALNERVLIKVNTAGNPLMHTAAGGMRLENYLSTRTFELVVHSLDIAAAVPDIEPPEFSDQLLSEVARVGATAAVLQGRGVELMLALTGRGSLSPGFSIV